MGGDAWSEFTSVVKTLSVNWQDYIQEGVKQYAEPNVYQRCSVLSRATEFTTLPQNGGWMTAGGCCHGEPRELLVAAELRLGGDVYLIDSGLWS